MNFSARNRSPSRYSAPPHARLARFGQERIEIVPSKHSGKNRKALTVDSARPIQVSCPSIFTAKLYPAMILEIAFGCGARPADILILSIQILRKT